MAIKSCWDLPENSSPPGLNETTTPWHIAERKRKNHFLIFPPPLARSSELMTRVLCAGRREMIFHSSWMLEDLMGGNVLRKENGYKISIKRRKAILSLGGKTSKNLNLSNIKYFRTRRVSLDSLRHYPRFMPLFFCHPLSKRQSFFMFVSGTAFLLEKGWKNQVS